MRLAVPLVLLATLALTACAQPGTTIDASDSPSPSPSSPASSPESTAPTAPNGEQGSTTASPTTSATASAAPLVAATGVPLDEAPACGDGVVLAAAMVDLDSPDAAGWLAVAEPAVGFEPAALLDGAAAVCTLTFRTEPDGAESVVEVSHAYVRGDDVGALLQSRAVAEGYSAVATEESFPLAFESAAEPGTRLEAFPLDWDALGSNGIDWHRQISGFALEPTDWVVIHTRPSR
ncbi:hypothetical protein [Agrococcus sp. DT81.2]|uniref:hypothetical protein n=1 Tax=Agrococcus sp. DT81.2 TaxID=3393414 RepID=UPI003CE51AC8